MANQKLSVEDLLAYAAGELPADRAAAIRAHLAANPEAAATVVMYRRAAAGIAGDDSVAPTAEVLARAKAIFQRPAEAKSSWLDLVDAFIARIVFDSRVQAASVRSTAMCDRLHLGYESEDVEVDLRAERVDPSPEGGAHRWRIIGQVIAEAGVEPMSIAAVDAETSSIVAETVTDTRLAFDLALPPGRYDLCIAHPRGTVVLPGIELA